jgi:outer membrane receptor protein involved in Fe transport
MISKFRLLLVCGVATIALPGIVVASPAAGWAQDTQPGTSAYNPDRQMQLALNLGGNNESLTLPRGSVMQTSASGAGGTSPQQVESVTVTGSRIAGSAAQAPTPITALSDDQLQALSSQSIPAGLAKLPVFAPVRGSDTASDGGYQPTGNYMDLYGLGPIRTLVLQDGHRVTSTYYDGTVDVNSLPQMLIQRVEVVTGGASAVYGSDAVSGVVNFILDKHFEGLKGLFQGGISTFGDAKSFRVGLAGGTDVFDRGHFEWSAEFFNRDIIPADPRPYGTAASSLLGNGSASNPLRSVTNTRISDSPFGGLVTTGPFAGMQFAPDGTLVSYNPGTPTTTKNVAVGGDGGYKKPSFVVPSLQTAQFFGRFDYNFNDNITGYVQAGYSHARTYSHEQNLVSTSGSNALTIYSGNPYLKPAYQTQMDNAGVTSFNLNRYNEDFGGLLNLTDRTSTETISAGLQGALFDKFDWELYYTHGEGRVQQVTHDNVNTQRMYAAIDAVRDPRTGDIVCRVSITAPGAYPGCVPMDILGDGAPSKAAISYVNGVTQWKAINTLDDFGANITGTLFDNWAGPVKMAVGAEYRLQSLVETSSVADNSFNIQNLRVGLNGNTLSAGALQWTKNVTSPMHGADSVYEGDVEIDVPLVRDVPLIQTLDFSGAARYTQYSTSGPAETWRLGLQWRPIDDLRFRATRSRDIRAPTLYDLFQNQSSQISGLVDYLTSAGGSVLNVLGGNPNLVPEVARNTTAGFVYTPGWLPNFLFQVDYYHAVIDNAIATVSGSAPATQQICIASGGTSPLCDLVVRPYPITNTTPANYPTLNYNVKQNVALVYAEGIDFTAGYETDLSEISNMNGVLGIHVTWVHQPTLKSQTLPGTTIINAAGTSQTPKDRVSMQVNYVLGSFSTTVVQRYYAAYHYSGNPTQVGISTLPAYWQTDLNLDYDFEAVGQPVTGFLNINNVFNNFGANCCAFTNNPGMQYPVASFTDRIGRYFTVGLRFKTN